MVSIEIFPAEKSCEQGCMHCPLARKDNELVQKRIDKNVQISFSLLEATVKRKKQKYDMHFPAPISGSFGLFPKLKYPEIIHMSRFETSKAVRNEGGPKSFAKNVRTLLDKKSIKPKIIGFSVVPHHPLVDDTDMKIVEDIFDNLSTWYFKSKGKKIEATVRSNLIPLPLFKMVEKDLFENDNKHIKKSVQKMFGKCKYKRKPHRFDFVNALTYLSEYKSEKNRNFFSITNRVITIEKSEKTLDKIRSDQALYAYPANEKSVMDFAIAPRGVMLTHSSIYINNPILWMSHEDFRNQLIIQSWKHGFTFLKFLQNLITQNQLMYTYVQEKYPGLKLDEYKIAFEQLRPHFIKIIEKAPKE